ncbi:MAG: SHOCT domain-containing protein [Bacteroidia bacterium]
MKHFFDDFGLEIDFSIPGGIHPSRRAYRSRCKNTQMNMVGDLQRFTQFQMATAMEKSAENPGGGNIGADIGTGMAMANMMNQTFQNSGGGGGKDDIIKMLKELGELKAAGVLTEEEFSEKKKQLLDRI